MQPFKVSTHTRFQLWRNWKDTTQVMASLTTISWLLAAPITKTKLIYVCHKAQVQCRQLTWIAAAFAAALLLLPKPNTGRQLVLHVVTRRKPQEATSSSSNSNSSSKKGNNSNNSKNSKNNNNNHSVQLSVGGPKQRFVCTFISSLYFALVSSFLLWVYW